MFDMMMLYNIILLPTTKSFCTTRNYSILSTLACVARIMRRGNSIAGVKTFCVGFSYNSYVVLFLSIIARYMV